MLAAIVLAIRSVKFIVLRRDAWAAIMKRLYLNASYRPYRIDDDFSPGASLVGMVCLVQGLQTMSIYIRHYMNHRLRNLSLACKRAQDATLAVSVIVIPIPFDASSSTTGLSDLIQRYAAPHGPNDGPTVEERRWQEALEERIKLFAKRR